MPPDISPRPYRSLTRRLLFWVLSISAFNALIAISVQLFMDYRRDLADLSDTLAVIRDSQIESIAAAAWNFDQNLLNVQMQGLVRSPWIGGAQVRYGAHEQAVVATGDINHDHEDQMEYPLEFDTGQRRIRVGRLIVEPNQTLILQRTLDRAVVVSLTQGFKTLAFSMIFLLLMRYLVTRHLRRMAVAVQHVEPGDDAPPLVLHRRPREPDDELTTLADALNRSYRRLNEFHKAEQRQRTLLEQEVRARTQHLQQALRDQQAIFDNTLTGMAFLRNRVFQRCNASLEKLLGYPPGGLIGQSTRILYPDDETYERQTERFMPVLLAGETYCRDIEYMRGDGRHLWLALQLKLIDPRDPQQGSVLAMQDVTARREAEAALARLAMIDGLTGIANRRAFDEALLNACRQARRNNHSLTLALIDVDHFKAYNDHYGHSAGDQALRRIAKTLAASARRPYDLAARYGGEEFALLLPACADSVSVLERLRVAVQDLAIPHAQSKTAPVITLSIGMVQAEGVALDNPPYLLKHADAALYRAKHQGRNQLCSHPPTTQAIEDKAPR